MAAANVSSLALFNSKICLDLWKTANDSLSSQNATSEGLLTQCIGTLLGANEDNFWVAYCNNPPDDGCPYGYCPNGDIAGFLTRLSAYIISFATACVLNMGNNSSEIIWSQLLTLYSLLVSGFISLAKQQLARIHAEVALLIVGSPLSCFLWGQTFWNLARFRRRPWTASTIARHVLLLVSFGLYLAFIIITPLPNKASSFFTQESCYQAGLDVFAPFFLLTKASVWIFPMEFLLLLLFVLVEWNRRKSAWLERQRGWYLSWANARVFARQMWTKYPHTRFMAFIGVPFIVWVWVTEGTAVLSGVGVVPGGSISFGQLLALFAAVPPVLAIFQVASTRESQRRVLRATPAKTTFRISKLDMQSYDGLDTFDPDGTEKLQACSEITEKFDPEHLSHHRGTAAPDEGLTFLQWWKDLLRSAITHWAWLMLTALIIGAAVGLVFIFRYLYATGFQVADS